MKAMENNRPRTKHILFLLNGVGCAHIFSRKQQSIGTLQIYSALYTRIVTKRTTQCGGQ